MWEKLSKIIKLIEKTGDKCIILSEQSEPIVLLGLNDYEKLNFQRTELSQMTQEELLDKINREIAIWRAINQDNEEHNIPDVDISKNLDNNNINFSKETDNQDAAKVATPSNKNSDENSEYLVEPVD